MAKRRTSGMIDQARRVATLALLTGGGLGFAAPTAAVDYVAPTTVAVLYDAPSDQAKPLYVLRAGTPVEQVVDLNAWVKVRDSDGHIAWIEKKLLGGKRQAMVHVDRAQIRASADEKAAVVFEAERDVLLDVLETLPGGWTKVRHRDGQTGFVKTAQLWGL
jgi:SH3-like domain-containing protein